jgi:hypothetical protein
LSKIYKILLVQLGANGDCLFVTSIAKQIKEIDYPGCNLTWMIGSKFKSILKNNKYVDEIIEIELTENYNLGQARENIHNNLIEINAYQKFDKVIITDYCLKNRNRWFGTIRSSLFRQYGNPSRLSPIPHLVLDQKEIDNVKDFVNHYDLKNRDIYTILFECAPLSGQSDMTINRAVKIASEIIDRNNSVKIILSSANKVLSNNENILDGSILTWRENAELTKYCKLLIGCSSGISWINTCDSAGNIPTIQTINPNYFDNILSCSMKLDLQYFNIPTDSIIEMHNASDNHIIDATILSINNFKEAKLEYDKEVPFIFSLVFMKELKGFFSFCDFYKYTKNILKNLRQIKYVYQLNKPFWFQPRSWLKSILNIKSDIQL